MAATAHAVAISPFEFIFCAKALLSRTAKTARARLPPRQYQDYPGMHLQLRRPPHQPSRPRLRR